MIANDLYMSCLQKEENQRRNYAEGEESCELCLWTSFGGSGVIKLRYSAFQ